MQLRGYQAEAVESARACFRRGYRAVLLVAPTGSGKTVIGAEIARLHFERAGQVVWLAHRIELVRQAVDKLRRAGLDVGAIAADGGFNERAPVVVCSIQTLLARPDARPTASLLIADEAHHYVSHEWRKLMAHYQGRPVIGLTATPQRSDGAALGDIFDALVEVATTAELVASGHLVPCEVIAPPRRLAGPEIADPVAALAKYAPGRKALIFAASVPEGRELARDIGSSAGFVDGDTPSPERAELLERFERGDLMRLVNVFVLTEGYDCPSVEVVVLARGVTSAAAFLQMIGRMRRPSPGKRGCVLLDCKGAVHMHGMPDDARRYTLHGRPIALDKGLPPLRQCPACAAVMRQRPTCERCGHVFAPVRSLERRRNAALGHVDKVTPETSKRAFLRSQLALAAVSGKRPGWAMHRFKWRFGHWPAAAWLTEERTP